jgi:FkbM family methyltransferase
VDNLRNDACLQSVAVNRAKTTAIALLNRLLPDYIKRSFFHLSFHLACVEFRRFAHYYGFAPDMRLGLTEMAGRRFSPKTIIDVGAYRGDWSRLARSIWPNSSLFMIEPNLTNSIEIANMARDLDATVFVELLGANNGQAVEFNVMGTGSSVFRERSAVPARIETRQLRRLDSLLKDIQAPAFLKIDAQGFELEILEGAGGLLPEVEAILIEISIIEINEGAPLLHDVIPYMKSLGFITYDILEIHRRPLDWALSQIDLIFIREQSPLLADKRHFK